MTAVGHSAIGTETLDDPAADPELVTRMLEDIARANRWLGGVRALEAGLARMFDPGDHGATFTLLDVGTGAGDLPRAATQWGARRGITIRGVGIERHRTAAHLARSNGVATVIACATRLPFRNVDVILISQLLHHFDDITAVNVLRQAHVAARRGVIVADLRPVPGAATAFRAAGRALGMHRTTIDDGVISLARGRSATAVAALARQAGATAPGQRTVPFARVVVAWRTDR